MLVRTPEAAVSSCRGGSCSPFQRSPASVSLLTACAATFCLYCVSTQRAVISSIGARLIARGLTGSDELRPWLPSCRHHAPIQVDQKSTGFGPPCTLTLRDPPSLAELDELCRLFRGLSSLVRRPAKLRQGSHKVSERKWTLCSPGYHCAQSHSAQLFNTSTSS